MDILDELKKLISKLNAENTHFAAARDGYLCFAKGHARHRLIDRVEFAGSEETCYWAAPMEFHGGKMHIHQVSKIVPGTGETLVLDLLIVTPAIKDAWDSRKKVEWEHGQISVVSPEGLILLKSFRKSGHAVMAR